MYTLLRQHRLRLLGHVSRMEDGRVKVRIVALPVLSSGRQNGPLGRQNGPLKGHLGDKLGLYGNPVLTPPSEKSDVPF